ncbi:MAG: type III pantothenate kinase [FCB group bacterium]|nr:type III pantothenate kinase [FCB group bacterium]
MLVAIDVGNTNIVIGLFEGELLRDHIRLATRNNITADEIGFYITNWLKQLELSGEAIDDVIISSVVPSLTATLETVSKKYLGCVPLILTHLIKLPIKIAIDQPEQLGADRIANAVAGYGKYGGPMIIVDFGTATTFDVIDDNGIYIGGIICPGAETSMMELAKRTARLFEIRIEPPDAIVGKSTTTALQSGLFLGMVGQVNYIIDNIIEETKFTNPKIIATGGLAKNMEKYSKKINFVEPTLTLEGLRIISELN